MNLRGTQGEQTHEGRQKGRSETGLNGHIVNSE